MPTQADDEMFRWLSKYTQLNMRTGNMEGLADAYLAMSVLLESESRHEDAVKCALLAHRISCGMEPEA